MFIGHFAVGFAAKRVAPRASLPVLLAAPQVLDILWPIFNLCGIERAHIQVGATAASPLVLEYMPYSHGLFAALGWSVLFGLGYAAIKRDVRTAIVLGLCVMSHWVLDWIAHAPDMPILHGDGPRYGLGMWNSIPATLAVEGAMLLVGALLYASVTRPRDRIGSIGLWTLVAVLAAMHVGAIFGPPPPSTNALFAVAIAAYSLLGVAWWIERHRETVRTGVGRVP
jgi:hypothetical protein